MGRLDAAGIVRRGEEVGYAGYVERYGEAPPCFVHTPDHCERPSTMEVYGLPMCEAHGEECASLAMEEVAHDLENELMRPLNDTVRGVSPHIEAALRAALEGIEHDHGPADAALLRAFPLVESKVCMGTRRYLEDPDAFRNGLPPFDMHMESRMLIHRLMRLAFEADADWLVQVLEGERETSAAQAAYALALDRAPDLRPGPREQEGNDR